MVEITIELDKARTDSTKYINQIIKNGNQNTKDKFNSILEEQTEFATKLYETLKKYSPTYDNCYDEGNVPTEFENYEELKKFFIKSAYGHHLLRQSTFRDETLNEPGEKFVKKICEYCFCNEVSEIDHFYEKVTNPELSILPLNLVPCCNSCNKRKNPKEVGFVYPNYKPIKIENLWENNIDFMDQIKNKNLWNCQINTESDGNITRFFTTFSINNTNVRPSTEYDVVDDFNKQLAHLKSFQKFEEQGNSYLNNIIEELRDCKKNDNLKDIQEEFAQQLLEYSYKQTFNRFLNYKLICIELYCDLKGSKQLWNKII